MNVIDIQKIPVFKFGLIFEADSYKNNFKLSESVLEFAYIAEGKLDVTKGTQKYTAEKGDILCGIRDVATEIKTDSYHCHHSVGIETLWTFTDNQASGYHIPYLIKHCPESDEIIKLIDKFIYSSHIYENSPGRTAELFFTILNKIDSISRASKEFRRPEYSLIAEKAKLYIQKNLNKPITQRNIAEHLGISPGYLCSVFKKSEGITLIKYVNMIKLKSIETIIIKENLPLYKAAEMYGYTNPNYVSLLYKKTFGRNISDKPDFKSK